MLYSHQNVNSEMIWHSAFGVNNSCVRACWLHCTLFHAAPTYSMYLANIQRSLRLMRKREDKDGVMEINRVILMCE